MLSTLLLATAAVLPAARALTWQQQANVTGEAAECSWEEFPALDALRSTYPPNWEIADLSFTGVEPSVQALWSNISSRVPSIQPRGTPNGDWTGVVYNRTADPDCWWTFGGCTTPKLAGLVPDTTTCLEPNTWGLTIDDGPNCTQNAYHDFLLAQNLKATLFYIGSNVENWPLQAQRGLGDGNEICVHTWSHQYTTSLTSEQVFAELYYTKRIIKQVTGVTPRCWRPPYGDVDDRVRFIAKELDLITVIWDNDTDDWNWINLGMNQIEANYMEIIGKDYSKHGTVVLSHELNDGTMNLSMQFLPQIKQKFTGGVMPLGVCSNNTNPYIEQQYSYPNYQQWAAGTSLIAGLPAPTAVSTSVELLLSATATATPSSATSSSASSTPAPASRSAAMSGGGTVLAQSRASASASDAKAAKETSKKSGAGKAGASAALLVAVAVAAIAV